MSLKQYQCNWCHKMLIDADWMSNVPMFQFSNVSMFQCSQVPMFPCSHVPMFPCSHVPMFQCSNVQMFKCSNVQMSSRKLQKMMASTYWIGKVGRNKSRKVINTSCPTYPYVWTPRSLVWHIQTQREYILFIAAFYSCQITLKRNKLFLLQI